VRTKPVLFAAGLALLAALPGCRIVKTGAPLPGADAQGSGAAQDPAAKAEAIWAPKLVPYVEGKAAPYPDLAKQLASTPDEAVKAHGYLNKDASTKPVVYARIDGTVVDVETQSRAGTVGIDVDGDGKADVTVQIGPVIRGSALRDGLSFVSFGDFANQIEFAEFSKALNSHVRDKVTGPLKRDALKGKHVSVLGAFFLDPSRPAPLVTPVTFTVSP